VSGPATVAIPSDYYGSDLRLERSVAGDARLVIADLNGPEGICRSTADADALLVTVHRLGPNEIAALGPRVRVIGRAGIGLDAIDLAAASERGIAVLNTPDYCTSEVATHTVAMVLALIRRLPLGDEIARRPGWGARAGLTIPAMEDLTVGVVGGGRIGRTVVERLRTFGPRVLLYDPYLAHAPDGAELVAELGTLLAHADIVTLHVPLTEQTRGLIGEAELRSMPHGSVLVNVARAELVDDAALVRALNDGRLGAAGIDVFAVEPLVEGSPLLDAPNTLLSPHVAWMSAASERRVRTDVLAAVLDYLAGRPITTGALAVGSPSRADRTAAAAE
jgi:D-3-phosphoglycerate dehydrogenase